MKRREFLNISAKLSAAPIMLGSVPVGVFQPLDLLQAVDCNTIRERVLIIIQMRGGNDGINTVIPIEQYETYAGTLRPSLRIDQSEYIQLDSGLSIPDQVGLHPAMTGIKELYDNGNVNIIQGTGYVNHNRSHFKSTDLYLTGGDTTTRQQAPAYDPDTDYGNKLNYILGVENDTNTYAKRISDVFNCGRNSNVDYPATYLANQLKTVARLMHGGSKTKVFLVDLNGFDTHVNQLEKHHELLEDLSKGVTAFMDDLDHGTISPMFVFGKHIEPGITGTNINLSELDNRAPTGFQHDYRQVFTSLLRDWLGIGDDALMATGFYPWSASALPLIAGQQIAAQACPLPTEHESSVFADANDSHTFSVTIPIPETAEGVTNAPLMELTDCDYVILAPGFHAKEGSNLRIFPSVCTELHVDGESLDPKIEFEELLNEQDDFGEIEAYPNPFRGNITASFKPRNDEKNINVQITDNLGKIVRVPVVHSFSHANYYNLVFNGAGLAKGMYYVVFFSEKRRKTIKVIKQ